MNATSLRRSPQHPPVAVVIAGFRVHNILITPALVQQVAVGTLSALVFTVIPLIESEVSGGVDDADAANVTGVQ